MNILTKTPLREVVDFNVTAYAVGYDRRLTLPYLIRLFQEAAMRNTVRLNISSPVLMATAGLSWVLRRQRVTVTRWPEMGDRVSVITAPSGFERGLLTYRDFHLVDRSGTPLATASSEWLLIDVVSRRLQPIPTHIARLAADLAPATAHLARPAGKIPQPEAPDGRRSTRVTFHQLDFNDHLTNPAFSELMLEPLGEDFLRGHHLAVADIAFQKEARYGDDLTALSGPDDAPATYLHALKRGEDLLATMRTEWRPKAG